MRSFDKGLLALAAFTLGAMAWGLNTHGTPPASSSPESFRNDAFDVGHFESFRFIPMSEAVGNISDVSRPWTLAVLGDSTGNESGEWVHLVVTSLAERTGRAAEIHSWSIETDSYREVTKIPGIGEPIVVWNGSASGKHTGYSLDNRRAMVPHQPNLIIVNHGHNQQDSDETATEVRALAQWAKTAWRSPPALAVTLQNPRTDERATRHAEIVQRLRAEWGSSEEVTTIDVYAVFSRTGNFAELLDLDGFHPSDSGEALWAATVTQSLGLDGVTL